jgi:hypothetical protein
MVLLSFSGGVYAAEINAVIREYSGDVEVKAAGGEWVPAREGMTLENSALISTGFKSMALLGIGNSTVLVRPLTRLSVEELSAREGTEEVELGLRAGRIRVNVTPPSSGKTNFAVRAPTVTASVRGTSFEFDAINLAVHSGTVAFTGRDNATIIVSPGKSAIIDRQGRSAAPVSAEERELARIIEGAAAGASGGAAVPSGGGPVSPVVAGPGGVLGVPGVIGKPGGGVSTPTQGDAIIGATW